MMYWSSSVPPKCTHIAHVEGDLQVTGEGLVELWIQV